MNNPRRFEFSNSWLLVPLLFALVASGCSIEKRTLMSGFHVEHRGKDVYNHPANWQPEQVTCKTEPDSDAYAASEDAVPALTERDAAPFLPSSLEAVTHRPPSSMHVFSPDREAMKVAPIAHPDTAAGTEITGAAFPELTPLEQDLWRRRAISRGITSLTGAALAFLWAAVASWGLPFFFGMLFLLSAVKWFVLATKPMRLRQWRDEKLEARENRSPKSILIRTLKWLLAIPIAIGLVFGLLLSLSGGL
jgi:hypothetical protein